MSFDKCDKDQQPELVVAVKPVSKDVISEKTRSRKRSSAQLPPPVPSIKAHVNEAVPPEEVYEEVVVDNVEPEEEMEQEAEPSPPPPPVSSKTRSVKRKPVETKTRTAPRKPKKSKKEEEEPVEEVIDNRESQSGRSSSNSDVQQENFPPTSTRPRRTKQAVSYAELPLSAKLRRTWDPEKQEFVMIQSK